jgi:hypothetical protein
VAGLTGITGRSVFSHVDGGIEVVTFIIFMTYYDDVVLKVSLYFHQPVSLLAVT